MPQEMPEDVPDDLAPRGRGVQSVEVGVRILAALADAGGPLALSEIAARVGMPAAKVHRYMASFVTTGMVDHRRSGAYDLGPLAARLGMAAVARMDVVNRAADRLPALVDASGCTAMLSVWGDGGPTVVRWERARRPLVTALGVGAVLPVLGSATGRAFAAALPERVVLAALARAGQPGGADDIAACRAVLAGPGLFVADQDFIPGLRALAAPVPDLQGQAGAVVTLVTTDPAALDLSGPEAEALRRFVAAAGA